MSIINKRNTSKIDILLKQDKKIFHTKDLKMYISIYFYILINILI